MLLRNGVDIIYISRIHNLYDKYNQKFVDRVFTQREILACSFKDVINISKLAKRFAAKEAFSKALGTGIGKISFKDIEVVNISTGEPTILLTEKIKSEIQKLFNCKNIQVSLSLSDEKDIAIAFVIMILS